MFNPACRDPPSYLKAEKELEVYKSKKKVIAELTGIENPLQSLKTLVPSPFAGGPDSSDHSNASISLTKCRIKVVIYEKPTGEASRKKW
jgi:hypothetical protein